MVDLLHARFPLVHGHLAGSVPAKDIEVLSEPGLVLQPVFVEGLDEVNPSVFVHEVADASVELWVGD